MNASPPSKSLYPFIIIATLWIPTLAFDSPKFAEIAFEGRSITTVLMIGLTFATFWLSSFKMKILMLIMIPLSWLGEYLCCVLMDMYDYQNNQIPIYVPFGHACLFSLGWNITQRSNILNYANHFKKWMLSFYIILFLIVIFYFQDTLSFALGILFFWALRRKGYIPFYLLMSLLVLLLEIYGTQLELWAWDKKQWIFTTVNPPIGSMFIYIGGDIILGRLVRFLLRKSRSLKQKSHLRTLQKN